MNGKKKLVRILGFTAHCVLSIPIILCDFVRAIIAYGCIGDFHNGYNSVCDYIHAWCRGMRFTMLCDYATYMEKDITKGPEWF